MRSFSLFVCLVKKDLRIDFRTKDIFLSMFIFALLVLVIFNFSFDFNLVDRLRVAPAILWVAILFSTVLGLNKSFSNEKVNDTLFGIILAPVDPGLLYLSKFASNLLFLIFVEVFLTGAFILFFNIPLGEGLLKLVMILLLADVGIISLGTLVSAMAVNTRAKETMLPIILFPMLVPVILSAINLTTLVVNGLPLENGDNWLKMIIAFDIIFLFSSWLTFDYIIKE